MGHGFDFVSRKQISGTRMGGQFAGLAGLFESGTGNLFKHSWAYGGGQPVLTEGDVFTAWVPVAGTAEVAQKLDVDWTISHMLEAYGYLTITAVAGISGVTGRTVRRHVSSMVKAGRLRAVGEILEVVQGVGGRI